MLKYTIASKSIILTTNRLPTGDEVHVDPFIRIGYQIDNLIDFIQMVKEVNVNDNIKINLSTSLPDENSEEIVKNFKEIQDELVPLGIEFNFDFEANHDRYIVSDNGWMIVLGRGLDIYEKFNRFSLQRASQASRRCKPFTISINKVNE